MESWRQEQVKGCRGCLEDFTDSVNSMAGNLTPRSATSRSYDRCRHSDLSRKTRSTVRVKFWS